MADKQKNSRVSDETLIWGCLLFFAMLILNRAYEFRIAWIRKPQNQVILILLIAGTLTPFFYWLARRREANLKKTAQEKAVIGKAEGSVFCGITSEKEEVHIKTRQRAMHTQVIGTTNAGKTESVILPWAIQDIEQGGRVPILVENS